MTYPKISIHDYVSICDEDQLQNLIERAQSRLKTIEDSGWTKLWSVEDEWMHFAYFRETEYELAAQFVHQSCMNASKEGRMVEISIRPIKVRPCEVDECLKHRIKV